jgi:hypothetical protein
MPNNLFDLGKFSIAGKLLTSSAFVALAITINTTVLAQPATAPIPTPSPSSQQTNPINQKLLGEWQIQDATSPLKVNLIFTPEDKLFFVVYESNSPVAVEFNYVVNSTPQPMQLDVQIPSLKKSVLTIFEFTPDGQLRVQLEDTDPGKPRPKAFTSKATLFKKIAETGKLPANAQIIDPYAQNQVAEKPSRPDEGKATVSTMNRGQQAYYLEYGKFATTIAELQVGIKPEGENYRYRVLSSGKGSKSVINTAAAKKPGLKSYTGVVFVQKVQGENLTITAVCETLKPSTVPPAQPRIPRNPSQKVQCPAGSRLL